MTKMRAELANLNHCAVSLLSRAAANLCWYYYILQHIILHRLYSTYANLSSNIHIIHHIYSTLYTIQLIRNKVYHLLKYRIPFK